MAEGVAVYFADHRESIDLGRLALRGGVASVAMQYGNGVAIWARNAFRAPMDSNRLRAVDRRRAPGSSISTRPPSLESAKGSARRRPNKGI
jgi:hypothetical protein